MKVLKYVIKGCPRTKKNSQMIAGAGKRCPVCHKFENQWIKQGKAHDEYAELAGWQLRPRPVNPIEWPINIKCLFYMDTNRIVDQLNLLACVDDLLVNNGIIKDDNSRIVKAHDGSRVLLDRDNPRTEIYITRMPAEDNGQTSLFD